MKTGRWRVVTQTASYDIDVDNELVRRNPRDDPNPEWPQALMRKDGDVVPLIEVLQCEVGQPMHLLIMVSDDPKCIGTLRMTTPVVEIIDCSVKVLSS